MTNRDLPGRQISGWVAVAASTGLACLWGWWGSIENFHEGWYDASLWRNLCLMLTQYLSPMLIVMLMSALALHWRRLAIPLLAGTALAVEWFLRGSSAGRLLLAIPLVALGALYAFGQPEPRKWAWRCLIGLPLVTTLASGAYPGWLAVHRFDDGNYGMRQVTGNGVSLVWAPAGPGWPEDGASWYEATQSCALLAADGRTLAASPQKIWRLPTVDETVRSLVFRGSNAGGTWDSVQHRAHYRTMPDKDSPLWRVHSQVIYWWTDTQAEGNRAYYVTSNGFTPVAPKQIRPGDLAFRCVTEPQKLDAANGSMQ